MPKYRVAETCQVCNLKPRASPRLLNGRRDVAPTIMAAGDALKTWLTTGYQSFTKLLLAVRRTDGQIISRVL